MSISNGSDGSDLNLRGFSKESTGLINEMQRYGWTFRNSNHGAVGRSPDGKATTSISRNIGSGTRKYKIARGDFNRWLRAVHPKAIEIAEDYVTQRREAAEVDNPVIAGILADRAVVRTDAQINALSEDVRQSIQTQTQTESESTTVTITETKPWTPRGNRKDDTTRVLERTWSTGRVDYRCTVEGCTFTSRNPRSVSQHYGATHTRATSPLVHPELVESAPQASEGGNVVIDDADHPAVEGGVYVIGYNESVDGYRHAYYDGKRIRYTRYAGHPDDPRCPECAIGDVPGTDTDVVADTQAPGESTETSLDEITANPEKMLQAIQGIVSRPLLRQMRGLADEVVRLDTKSTTLEKERDEALAELAKIRSDLDALRSLVAGIGRMTL